MVPEIKENEILANHSTFRIGGPAAYFAEAQSREDLIGAINFAKEKGLPFFVFGGGSNILFRDEGFVGVAIKMKNSKLELTKSGIVAGAGVPLGRLINFSVDNGLAGLEWGTGIPGTVGGGVAGNCGAYGHSISESVERVTVLDEDGRIKKYTNDECEFRYRGSKFKNPDNREIILEIAFKLEKGDKVKSKETVRGILEKRKGKIVPYPSAGCSFKNIIIDELKNKDDFLKLIPEEKIMGGKFPTAWLMEDCGLKGEQVGGAKVSDEHANFIVNADKAKAVDVLELMALCKKTVRGKFNIELEEELVVLPRQE